MNEVQRENLQEAEILLLMNRGDDEVCVQAAELIHGVLTDEEQEIV
jgi:hypothetical protein